MKLSRQAKILEIIEKNEIETQEELAEHLKAAGFRATRPTAHPPPISDSGTRRC